MRTGLEFFYFLAALKLRLTDRTHRFLATSTLPELRLGNLIDVFLFQAAADEPNLVLKVQKFLER